MSFWIISGTVVISIITSIITVRWMMEKEIEFLNQLYRNQRQELIEKLEEMTMEFVFKNGAN